MSEKIDFKFNQPVTLTLAFAEGRAVPSRFPGSVRTMRTTKDARVFFCDPQLEAKLKALNPAPGVQVEIVKLEREGARKGYDWKVSRIGEQADGTYKIQKADPSTPVSESASALPKHQSDITACSIVAPQITPTRRPVSTGTITAHCRQLAECLHKLKTYAKENKLAVTPEDARSITISVYIQQMQGQESGRAA